MSAQLSIAYDPAYVGSEAWKRVLEILRTAVEHLGRKEAAYVFDVSGSQLSDSLSERDRKRWAGEWICQAFAMLEQRNDPTSRNLRRELAEALLSPTALVVEERAEITPEEEAAMLRRELLALGDAGKAAVERVKRRKK